VAHQSPLVRRAVIASMALLMLASAAAAQTQQVRVGGVVLEPQKIKHVEPVYPEDARLAGTEGSVLVDVTIGTEGLVTDARVVNPQPPFVESALAAVRQWRYAPTLLNGQPVEVLMTVTVRFTLNAVQNPTPRVTVGGEVTEPKLLKRVEPRYPRQAILDKTEGMVIIEAVIGTDGSILDAKALRPSPDFEETALAAVRQWRYTPTLLNGQPVEVQMIVTIHFRLKSPRD